MKPIDEIAVNTIVAKDDPQRRAVFLGADARKPRGYVGIGHETIGSDILALSRAVLMPDQVLGKEMASSIRGVETEEWYPIRLLLEPLERLDAVLGESSLRKIGWKLFELSHREAMRAAAKSVKDIVYGIDGMYHRANRGKQIGGWKVLSFEPGEAVLEKTTPHHCIMEEGILEAGCKEFGVNPTIFQNECFRKGGEVCRITIRSHVTDARWTGEGTSKGWNEKTK
ncbi:MAG TPA: hypothetical protein VF407_20255 [Polyangiaceae bacterium]